MPRPRIDTPYVVVDVTKCSACGRCAAACARGVLEARAFNDPHVRVVRPRECTGCYACIAACREGALRRVDGAAD